MRNTRPSLMDVINPPLNPWLEEISQRNAKLPAGVRVVRLGGDDDGDDLLDQQPSPRSPLAHVPTQQAA